MLIYVDKDKKKINFVHIKFKFYKLDYEIHLFFIFVKTSICFYNEPR